MKREKIQLGSGLSKINRYFKVCIPHVVGGVLALNTIAVYAEIPIGEKPAELKSHVNEMSANSESQVREKSDETKKIAASVNGVQIEISMLAPQVEKNVRKYKKYGMKQSEDDLRKFMRMQALESLIATELIYQEAKKIKVDDLDERIKESLSNIDEEQKNQEEYNEEEMRQAITKRIMIEEYLVQQKLKDYKVPEEEVVEYYNNNNKSFKQGKRIRSRHVLVSVASDAKSEEKEAAHEKITEAHKLLQEGKPFAGVAKEYSDCNSASSGGELGYHEKGYMPQEYDDVAFSLESEELSGIVETQHGYHLIQVLDQKPSGIQPYEEVKDFIWRYLNIEHQKKAMKDHIAGLRNKAKVDIYL
jgi:peptidyl-prolyl cis-trans isomerase C